jgi:hypothetical protein
VLTRLWLLLFFTLVYAAASSDAGSQVRYISLSLLSGLIFGTLVSMLPSVPLGPQRRRKRKRGGGMWFKTPPPGNPTADRQCGSIAGAKPEGGRQPDGEPRQTARAAEQPEPRDEYAGMELKTLYRMAAKRFHPDLATDERERQACMEVMAALNEAYRSGNQQWIITLLKTGLPARLQREM